MDAAEEKSRLRRVMRDWRRSLSDQELARRSRIVVERLANDPAVSKANHVMGFTAVRGEPDLGTLGSVVRARGARWSVPEDDLDRSVPDVVIVPGVAFTTTGDRLGQGGGWYDRFLPGLPKCTEVIGVCFAEQLLKTLPIEAHDVVVHRVVTDCSGDDQVSS